MKFVNMKIDKVLMRLFDILAKVLSKRKGTSWNPKWAMNREYQEQILALEQSKWMMEEAYYDLWRKYNGFDDATEEEES